jgi:hypothetical protein
VAFSRREHRRRSRQCPSRHRRLDPQPRSLRQPDEPQLPSHGHRLCRQPGKPIGHLLGADVRGAEVRGLRCRWRSTVG